MMGQRVRKKRERRTRAQSQCLRLLAAGSWLRLCASVQHQVQGSDSGLGDADELGFVRRHGNGRRWVLASEGARVALRPEIAHRGLRGRVPAEVLSEVHAEVHRLVVLVVQRDGGRAVTQVARPDGQIRVAARDGAALRGDVLVDRETSNPYSSPGLYSNCRCSG